MTKDVYFICIICICVTVIIISHVYASKRQKRPNTRAKASMCVQMGPKGLSSHSDDAHTRLSSTPADWFSLTDPAVNSNARWRHQNLAQQPRNSNNWLAAKQWLPVVVDGRELKKASWGTKLRWWRGQISVRSMAVVMGFGCGFSSLKRRRSGQFPTKMTVKVWPASHKLSIDTLLGRSGGRNCEIWPGYVRGLGRVFGFVVGSVWQLLSHVHVSVFALFFQLLLF